MYDVRGAFTKFKMPLAASRFLLMRVYFAKMAVTEEEELTL